jgi:hypothetical protein
MLLNAAVLEVTVFSAPVPVTELIEDPPFKLGN